MRIKRILITLLVALMMVSLVAITSAADETKSSFDIVTGLEAETAVSDGVLCNTEDGVEFDFNVKIKSNPGIGIITLHVYYDDAIMTFIPDSVKSDVYTAEEILSQDNDGDIAIALITDGVYTEENVDLVTLTFKLNGGFDGEIKSLLVNEVVVPDVEEINVEQGAFEAHAYTSSKTQEATCTSPASVTYVCEECSDECVIVTGPTADHSWSAATCTAPKTCSVCGTTEGDVADHSYSVATCTAPKTCSVCGATDGEALPHNFADATCTAPKTCPDCGATEGDPADHKYGEWSVSVAPTTEKAGEEERVCAVCQDKETRPVDKLVDNTQSKGWVAAVIIIAVVVVVAGVVVGVVFYKKKNG